MEKIGVKNAEAAFIRGVDVAIEEDYRSYRICTLSGSEPENVLHLR